jgi:hypothetical protein
MNLRPSITVRDAQIISAALKVAKRQKLALYFDSLLLRSGVSITLEDNEEELYLAGKMSPQEEQAYEAKLLSNN